MVLMKLLLVACVLFAVETRGEALSLRSAVAAAAANGALPDAAFCIMRCPSGSTNCPGHCRNCENGSTRWGRGTGWGLCGNSDLQDEDTKLFYTDLFASMCDPNFNSLDGDAETGSPDDPGTTFFDDMMKWREEHPNEDPASEGGAY
jgi:hypothetical protein